MDVSWGKVAQRSAAASGVHPQRCQRPLVESMGTAMSRICILGSILLQRLAANSGFQRAKDGLRVRPAPALPDVGDVRRMQFWKAVHRPPQPSRRARDRFSIRYTASQEAILRPIAWPSLKSPDESKAPLSNGRRRRASRSRPANLSLSTPFTLPHEALKNVITRTTLRPETSMKLLVKQVAFQQQHASELDSGIPVWGEPVTWMGRTDHKWADWREGRKKTVRLHAFLR